MLTRRSKAAGSARKQRAKSLLGKPLVGRHSGRGRRGQGELKLLKGVTLPIILHSDFHPVGPLSLTGDPPLDSAGALVDRHPGWCSLERIGQRVSFGIAGCDGILVPSLTDGCGRSRSDLRWAVPNRDLFSEPSFARPGGIMRR